MAGSVNSRSVAYSERRIAWRQLRGILQRDFACEIASVKNSGVVIRRTVKSAERGFLGRRKDELLVFQLSTGGEGREVGLGTVKTLRRELRLEEAHGVDSEIFYGDQKSADAFIEQYRGLLRALARV